MICNMLTISDNQSSEKMIEYNDYGGSLDVSSIQNLNSLLDLSSICQVCYRDITKCICSKKTEICDNCGEKINRYNIYCKCYKHKL